MIMVVRAIQRALEFLHSWVAKGFSWAHTEWWSKLLDITVSFAKKITWFYAFALLLVAQMHAGALSALAMWAGARWDIDQLKVQGQAAFTAAADDRILVVTSAYNFFNYIFPVRELLMYLGVFLTAKLVVTIARMLVALYQLIPFKAS